MTDDYPAKIEQGHVSVAVEGNSVVGLIVLVEEPDHLLVENVAVDPSRQSVGIGRTLLALAEETAQAAGLSTLRLYTNAAMTENLVFYPDSATKRRIVGRITVLSGSSSPSISGDDAVLSSIRSLVTFGRNDRD